MSNDYDIRHVPDSEMYALFVNGQPRGEYLTLEEAVKEIEVIRREAIAPCIDICNEVDPDCEHCQYFRFLRGYRHIAIGVCKCTGEDVCISNAKKGEQNQNGSF